jgi:hypothetical protein
MSKAAELANLIGNINAGGGGVNRNVLINSAMNVAQRATSATGKGDADGYFVCDRWNINVGATSTGRFTLSQDSSAPSGFANSLKFDCTTADTSIAAGENMMLQQKIEGQNVQSFAKGTSDAKPFALSFYVKGNASATYVAALYDGDNSRVVASTFSVTTDWARVEITFPADTTGALDDDNASSLELWIVLHAGSNFTSGTLASTWASYDATTVAAGGGSFFDSTDRTFFITGVQLEVGQNATEFEHEPFATTLHKCERYFQKWDLETAVGTGLWFSANQVLGHLELRQNMCNEPTMSVSSADFVKGYLAAGASDANDSSSPFDLLSTISCRFNLAMVSTGTNGQGCLIQMKASEYIHADAEVGT